ncbi:TetR/AcrR family transcriptional regulator [Microbacterium rhizomatis]|uniref:TetR/AcrR family transcriptional regulator n=1 Tax=Microbacterium rhizomatis TaxID=1631477 RepID=A0A5J5IZ50_9MICO|nr:TetR/AcrR family transcriptional regulator [Microbacterium rhizomatis]KAA9104747.1 TetR/AcrR family transcriptional regulator [Microbacterium rhizomatis]
MVSSSPAVPVPTGRRERNKREKLERILAAASELFAEHGVDEVTTQQIADRADIGSGTLFLYARTKAELLLMVQNSHYSDALRRGVAAADAESSPLDAVLAIVGPIVECNRAQIDNGRTYLREMVFGDPTEPHHAEALRIVTDAEAAMARAFLSEPGTTPTQAGTLARTVSAIMFLAMAASVNTELSVEAIIADIRKQTALLTR